MFTYDNVWDEFLLNYKVEEIELPQTEEHVINIIKTNVKRMNARLHLELICDDATETITNLEKEEHLLILVTFIKLNFIENANTYAENLAQPFTQDVGITNTKNSLLSFRASMERVRKELDDLIFQCSEDYL